MPKLARLGRWFFWAAILAFATLHLAASFWPQWPLPGPPWWSGDRLERAILGAGLLVSVVATLSRREAHGALALILFLLSDSTHWFVGLISEVRAPGPWTSAAELMALTGAALVLAFPNARARQQFGLRLFASTLLVFALQHFLYGEFIASLIPEVIPARQALAYAAGGAFRAASVAILTKPRRLAAGLLAAMFFSWVLVVHLPRVLASPGNGDEWTSLFVALAMGGAALIVGEVSLAPANHATFAEHE